VKRGVPVAVILAALLLAGCVWALPRNITQPAGASFAVNYPGETQAAGKSADNLFRPEKEAGTEDPSPRPKEVDTVFTWEPLPAEIRELITGSSWREGSPVPPDRLAYLTLTHHTLEGGAAQGHMIVHESLAKEVAEIFEELYAAGYPIANMQLVDDYGADDDRSMEANNTYAFCHRDVAGKSTPSLHSYGVCIDINPWQNPYIRGGTAYPPQSRAYLDRGDVRPGMIVRGDACYNAFVSRGWTWGGHWSEPVDYQHFEKSLDALA